MKVECNFGEVEVISTEEEKNVYYSLMENGQDLKPETEVHLEGYVSLLDENMDKFNAIYGKEELTIDDAKVMYDILNKLYDMHEYNDMSSHGNYTFCMRELVKEYRLKEKVDW